MWIHRYKCVCIDFAELIMKFTAFLGEILIAGARRNFIERK